MDFVNKEAARRGGVAVHAYAATRQGQIGPVAFETKVELTCLLLDLMHFATQEEINLGACLRQAKGTWAAEVKPKRQGVSHPVDETNLRIAGGRVVPWWLRWWRIIKWPF